MKQFIKTTDKETAEKLIQEGFKLMSQVNNVYTFLNQPPQNFSFDKIDKRKIAYDNIFSL